MLGDRSSRVMTRELLYTALTRARERAIIIATPEVIHEACTVVTRRGSGLAGRIWGHS